MDDVVGAEITGLLQAWRQGDKPALDGLTPHVHRELHLAAGERDGHTLETTALIISSRELSEKKSDEAPASGKSRKHFS